MWDPAQYSKFGAERARPFADLIAQVPAGDFRTIVDLGCGTGNLTRTLADRWPAARIVGVDNSPQMLQQARALSIPGRLDFIEADVASWQAEGPIDLIVSNAALHWVSDHDRLLERLVGMLSHGGVLAVQIPTAFREPAHLAVEEIIAQPRWQSLLKHANENRAHVQPIFWYGRKLLELGLSANVWHTNYVHVLHGDDPVLEWLKGTTLRPILGLLDSDQQREFLAELAEPLRRVFPTKEGVTLFPFPRLFFVGAKNETGE